MRITEGNDSRVWNTQTNQVWKHLLPAAREQEAEGWRWNKDNIWGMLYEDDGTVRVVCKGWCEGGVSSIIPLNLFHYTVWRRCWRQQTVLLYLNMMKWKKILMVLTASCFFKILVFSKRVFHLIGAKGKEEAEWGRRDEDTEEEEVLVSASLLCASNSNDNEVIL